MIYYAGSHKIKDRINLRCGEYYHQIFSGLAAPYLFSLRKTKSEEEKLAASFAGGDISLSYKKTELPGNYTVFQNGRAISLFSVNPWPQESQYNFYQKQAWKDILPGSILLRDDKNLAAEVFLNRQGKPLWNYMLALALFLLLIEMLLSRTASKNEFSQSIGTETIMAQKG